MKESTNFIERRKEYRLPYSSKIILCDGGRSATAYAANVSRGGLFIMSLDPFPIDTKLHMVMLLPDHPNSICLRAKVVHIVYDRQRCEVECGMGIQFIELNESHKSILNLHILNEKMAYMELRKLLAPAKPNMAEVIRWVKKLPTLREIDLAALRYRVNRICTIFEPIHDPIKDGQEEKMSA